MMISVMCFGNMCVMVAVMVGHDICNDSVICLAIVLGSDIGNNSGIDCGKNCRNDFGNTFFF